MASLATPPGRRSTGAPPASSPTIVDSTPTSQGPPSSTAAIRPSSPSSTWAARVGLILAATFAFILSFGDYVSPAYLGGGKPPTMSILIVDQTKSGNHWPRASVVAVTMVVTLIIVLFGSLFAAYGRSGGRK